MATVFIRLTLEATRRGPSVGYPKVDSLNHGTRLTPLSVVRAASFLVGLPGSVYSHKLWPSQRPSMAGFANVAFHMHYPGCNMLQ